VEANDAYYKADHAAAKAKYEKLLEAGLGGPDVLFNLGTTHLALSELGPAMLYLERAHRLAPDDDVEANLALARQKQVDQVVGEDAAVPFTQRLADAVDEPLVSGAFLGSWWLAFVLLWLWRRARGSRVLLGVAGSGALAAALALGAVVGTNVWVRRSVIEAVVIPATSKVLEFPGANAKTAFEVHAGLKVRVMEESGRFVRIRLPNALEGWTPKDAVVEL